MLLSFDLPAISRAQVVPQNPVLRLGVVFREFVGRTQKSKLRFQCEAIWSGKCTIVLSRRGRFSYDIRSKKNEA